CTPAPLPRTARLGTGEAGARAAPPPLHDALPISFRHFHASWLGLQTRTSKPSDAYTSWTHPARPQDSITTRSGSYFLRTVNRYRSEEHTSELQSREKLVCPLLLEKTNKNR